MTKLSMALSLTVFVAVGIPRAQELRTTPIAEPKYINSFYAVDSDGKLIELERQTVTFKTNRFEEYGASSYRITPDQPLAPGEYALAMRGSVSELYCFGVDH